MASDQLATRPDPIPWWRSRIALLLATAGVVALPAGVLRGLCAGRSCDRPGAIAGSDVPFCSLSAATRRELAAGFRDGRSPNIVTVTGTKTIRGGTGIESKGPAWLGAPAGGRPLPIVFAGSGIAGGAEIASGTTLDGIAPTLAEVLGYDRPHPEVRSGSVIGGVASGGRSPRLVLEVIWKNAWAGSISPGKAPFLEGLIEGGASTMEGRAGSLPLDPAAVMTTIGTGGLPRQHGVTGTLVLNDDGDVARAWSKRAPVHVIATLADDLDHSLGQRPFIGIVATDPADRGAIGGGWYVGGDRDEVVISRRASPERQAAAAARLLQSGRWGSDGVVDLLAVVMEGPAAAFDDSLRTIVEAADTASGGAVTTVVAATGGPPAGGYLGAPAVRRRIEKAVPGPRPVVEATSPEGLFLDQATLERQAIPSKEVVSALQDMKTDSGPLFADVFPGIAVSFARYC